jgi:hypothetical protein
VIKISVSAVIPLSLAKKRGALAAAALVGLVSCGGGGGGSGGGTPPPPPPGDTTPPTLSIVDETSELTTSGNITFDFTFSEDVGSSFDVSDVVVSGGTISAWGRTSPTSATLVLTPLPLATGTATVSVAAGAFSDLSGNANVASSQASQAYDTTHAGWNLVWSDEFDTPGLPDASKWDYDLGGGGWGNNEKQVYTKSADNARVENGKLIIEARAIDPAASAGAGEAVLRDSDFNFVWVDFHNPLSPPGTSLPVLSITRSGATVNVTWTGGGEGWTLQQATDPATPAGWTDLGTENPQAVNVTPGRKFFRLIRR